MSTEALSTGHRTHRTLLADGKSAAGGVRTGSTSSAQIDAAVRDFRARFGSGLRGILVQPMSAAGLEFLVGITSDPLVGPMLTVGLSGTATDLVDDRSHCLVPPTEDDLDQVLAHLRSGQRLLGRPTPPGCGPGCAMSRRGCHGSPTGSRRSSRPRSTRSW
jgi:hypothetical protein